MPLNWKWVALAAIVGALPVPLVVPPLNETVGALVKPKPGAVMVTVELSTAGEVPERATVAVAPLPPPPLITTFGTAVYFWVLGVTVKVAALTPRFAVAFAPLPTPLTATVAGAVMLLP